MTTPKALLTLDDLMKLPEIECRYELVRGELVSVPFSSFEHGEVLGELAVTVREFTRRSGAGRVALGCGVVLHRNPDTVRAPDLCFVHSDRFPADFDGDGYLTIIPDLVAEVVSFNDLAEAMQQRIVEWLAAGVRLVWVLYPGTRTVYAYRSETDVRVYTAADTLDGGDVLPGFACAVVTLFMVD